jgi:3-oxoacyl-(acyl-carrier-protein) synthase
MSQKKIWKKIPCKICGLIDEKKYNEKVIMINNFFKKKNKGINFINQKRMPKFIQYSLVSCFEALNDSNWFPMFSKNEIDKKDTVSTFLIFFLSNIFNFIFIFFKGCFNWNRLWFIKRCF